MNLSKIYNQLENLEARNHIIELPNGSYMQSSEFITIFVDIERARVIADDQNRKVQLSDFNPSISAIIEGLSMLEPESQQGAICRFVIEQSKKIMDSDN